MIANERPTPGSDAGSALAIRLLGTFEAARRDGTQLKLPKKAQALLCYLVVNRDRVTARDEAATLLWSKTSSAQARQSLRQCLSALKKAFPSAASLHLKSDKNAVQLSCQPFDIDLVTFQSASGSRELRQLMLADAAYRDDLLLGLNLDDEPFDEWLALERNRLRGARISILHRLARLRADDGDLAAAIDLARRLLALERYREESVRLLMELLVASDQRGLAVVEYAKTERLLRDDLGTLPDPMTRALLERIRRSTARQGGSLEQAHRIPHSRLSCSSMWRMRPKAVVLPFQNLTGSQRFDEVAHAVRQDVAIAASADRSLEISFADGIYEPDARLASPGAYALSGTIRIDADRLRIVAQLTRQKTGSLIWAGRFEDTVEGLSSSQDRICSQIAARASYAIRCSEVTQTRQVRTEHLSAYQLCFRAAAVMRDGKTGNNAALEILRHALAADPELGIAHALAARCFHVRRLMGWLSPNDPQLTEGIEHANAAVAYSGDDPEALWMGGLVIMNIEGDLPLGRKLLDESLALNPNSANAWIASSFIHCHLGNAAAALDDFGAAARLNPYDVSHHIQQNAASTAHFIAGDYEPALAASEACLALRPGYTAALRIKVATLGLLGQAEKAEMAARQLRTLEQGASISRMREYWKGLAPNAPNALDAKIEGWRRAGMPE